MSISVKNLSKFYGSQEVLKGISFDIEDKGIVGFLGPNGAGKSTTMKILSSSITPTSGSAEVCGLDVESNSKETRKQIGYLPEHNPLYLDMYVKEYLEWVASIYKINNCKKAIGTVIELTGLGVESHKKIGQLSKGYRQRVGLAQSLIHNPKVLILDEPTTGLDPNQILEIRSLIKEIGKEKTVMLSSHIMQEVEAVCDRVIIINKGKIVANDSTEVLKRKLEGNLIEIEFLEQVPENRIKELNFVHHVGKISNTKFLLQGRNNDIRPLLFKWAVENKYTIIGMQQESLHLESIFRKLTN